MNAIEVTEGRHKHTLTEQRAFSTNKPAYVNIVCNPIVGLCSTQNKAVATSPASPVLAGPLFQN